MIVFNLFFNQFIELILFFLLSVCVQKASINIFYF